MIEQIPYEREVQYYETDQMQIVHHSNYIRWFEEARLAYMKQLGVNYHDMEKQGMIVPVLSASAVYRLAFRYGDTFQVHVKLTRFNGVKMELSYEVYNKITGVLHTTGESSHCFLDKEMKPFSLKKKNPELYQIFKAAVVE